MLPMQLLQQWSLPTPVESESGSGHRCRIFTAVTGTPWGGQKPGRFWGFAMQVHHALVESPILLTNQYERTDNGQNVIEYKTSCWITPSSQLQCTHCHHHTTPSPSLTPQPPQSPQQTQQTSTINKTLIPTLSQHWQHSKAQPGPTTFGCNHKPRCKQTQQQGGVRKLVSAGDGSSVR
jgi:hypothetical protein